MVGSPSLAAALDATVELVARRLGFDVCSVYLFHPTSGELVLEATHGLRKESRGVVRMPPGEGLTGLVFQGEQSVFTSRAEEHPQFKFFPETGEEGFRSFGGVPLLRRGECIGVLTVQTAQEYAFSANERVALEALASQVVGLIGATRRLGRPLSEETQQLLPDASQRARRDQSTTLAGVGTSPGVGVGAAALLGVDLLHAAPPRRPFTEVGVELGRYETARAGAVDALEGPAARLEAAGDATAASVLRMHQELLRDGEIEARVRGRISEERAPVEQAVHDVFQEAAQELQALPSPLLRERAVDLLDARAELLSALGLGSEEEGALVAGVVVAPVLTPAQAARLDPARVVAVVTEHGSETSHASIVARSLGIPAVVGVPGACSRITAGERVLVDGDNGFVFLRPDHAREAEYGGRVRAARVTEARIQEALEAHQEGDGIPGVSVWANAGLPGELAAAREAGAEGVGLLRSELFFMLQPHWPSVEEQTHHLRLAFREAPAGPIIVRLLDAGGDKRLPFMEETGEQNPSLGLRAVRLLLAHPELARGHVEAILRAAADEAQDVRILVPMVTAPWELDAMRDIVRDVAGELGLAALPLGIMVETPAVLFQLGAFLERADFLSVGSNDLTQYLLAVDRDDERVRHYYSPLQPAVLRALDGLRESAAAANVPVSVCGEMASDPLGALALLALGYRLLSVRPRAVAAIRCLSRCVEEEDLASLRASLLASVRVQDTERALRRSLRGAAPFLLEA